MGHAEGRVRAQLTRLQGSTVGDSGDHGSGVSWYRPESAARATIRTARRRRRASASSSRAYASSAGDDPSHGGTLRHAAPAGKRPVRCSLAVDRKANRARDERGSTTRLVTRNDRQLPTLEDRPLRLIAVTGAHSDGALPRFHGPRKLDPEIHDRFQHSTRDQNAPHWHALLPNQSADRARRRADSVRPRPYPATRWIGCTGRQCLVPFASFCK